MENAGGRKQSALPDHRTPLPHAPTPERRPECANRSSGSLLAPAMAPAGRCGRRSPRARVPAATALSGWRPWRSGVRRRTRAGARGAGAGPEHVTAAPPPCGPRARRSRRAPHSRLPAARPSFLSSQCHRAGARAAAASAAGTMVRWAGEAGCGGTPARPPSYPARGLGGGRSRALVPRGSRACGGRAGRRFRARGRSDS